MKFKFGQESLLSRTDLHGPVFVQEPPNRVDFSNTTGARVDCTFHGTPTPAVQWLLADGTPALDVPEVRIVFSNGTLLFYPFPAEGYRQDVHAAVYRCRASNSVGAILSRDVRIRAVVLQIYEVQVYNEFVIRGNTAVLKCHIPSFVTDYVKVVSWVRDTTFNVLSEVETGGRYSIMSSGELHIRDVTPNDAYHSFRCRTVHRLTGETKISSMGGRLVISDPQGSVSPRITDSKSFVQVHQGDSAVLPCAAQGHPPPSYSWFVKSNRNHMTPVVLSERIQQIGGTLLIRNARIADSETYVCVVSSNVGNQSAVSVLSVTVPLTVYVQPHKLKVDVGGSVTLTCKASGYPIASLVWLKDAQLLRPQPHPPTALHIETMQREQRGMYQCLATNDHETAQGTAELRLGDAAPDVIEGFKEHVLSPGSFLSLRCIATGNPPPKMMWVLDDKSLEDSRHARISQRVGSQGDTVSYLNLTGIRTEDGGEYSCVAVNRLGNATHAARINVFGSLGIRRMTPMSVIAGEDVFAKCRVYGHPLESITWEKDGLLLPINRRQKIYPNDTLLILNVQTSDSGKYMCVVRGSGGETVRSTLEITVMVPPKVSSFSFQDEDLYEGMRAQVTCAVRQGDLPLTIKWLKDGVPIEDTPPGQRGTLVARVFDGFTSSLSIESVASEHNGNYTCVASNMAAIVSYSTTLRVNVPPRWMLEPRDSQVLVGGSARMDCEADGYPEPAITWMKAVGDVPVDFREIVANGVNVMVFANSSLLLTGVKESDQGYYLCQAANNIGEGLSKIFFIDVHIPVSFDVRSQNQSAKRGENVMLKCNAKGDLPIKLEWNVNSHLIDPDFRARYKIKESNSAHGLVSELIVTRSERADSGFYVCLATNAHGRDTTTIHLAVQEPPEAPRSLNVDDFDARSVHLIWSHAYDGNSPVLKYIVQYKHVLAEWFGGSANETVKGSTSGAVVSSLLPATKYSFRVMAENDVGVSEPSETVVVTTAEEAPSAAPIHIHIEATQPQCLIVSWKPPQKDLWHGEILGYNVGYRVQDTGEPFLFKTVEIETDGPGRLELRGLSPFTKYDVVVQAYNKIGSGPISDPIAAATAEEVPSRPPSDVRCSAHSSQSIHVTWSAPTTSSIHGVLQGYKVLYKSNSQEQHRVPFHGQHDLETKITSSLETILHGLTKFENYSIQVLAFTRVGDGARSDVIFCQTLEDVPEAPAKVKAVVTSEDSIFLTWLPPYQPNGLIIRYSVYIRTTNDDVENTTKTIVAGDQLRFDIKGLSKKQPYEFWVTSSTSIGEGQSTKMVSVIPNSKVAAKISSFGTTVVTPWKEEVVMECDAVGIPPPTRVWNVGGQALPQHDRYEIRPEGSLSIRNVHLTDSGNYSCRVENTHGSDEIHYAFIVQAPPVPPHLVVSSTTSNSVTVYWKPDANGGSPITGFALTLKREYGEWEETQLEADCRSHVIDNLWCGSRYQLYISAANSIGAGEPSEIASFKTKGSAPSSPSKEQFIYPDSEYVALNLNTWNDGGCSILYFIVEYKPKTVADWILVSNNVKPQRDTFLIPDLEPRVSYNLRVTAHNSAGSQTQVYDFTTRYLPGLFGDPSRRGARN
uniref:Down syndrome cell adhesion molecule-like protein Dscam2 n=1 Tax=Strigamia maritima TaxID=126957 RepID=T1JAD1_STRMM